MAWLLTLMQVANILWQMAKTTAIFRLYLYVCTKKIVHKLRVLRCYVYLEILMSTLFHLVWFKQSHMSGFTILNSHANDKKNGAQESTFTFTFP